MVLPRLGRLDFVGEFASVICFHYDTLLAREQTLGDTSRATAQTLVALGGVYSDISMHREAVESLEEALHILDCSKHTRAQCLELADVNDLMAKALLLSREGSTRAESHLRTALDIREKWLGLEHADVVRSRNNLGHAVTQVRNSRAAAST